MSNPMMHFVEASPEEDVAAVAARAIGPRLVLVTELLPLAALHADEDIENVHQLRVASRRAVAALDLFADLLPRGRLRRLRKALCRIRKAAGRARDCDVMLARWQGESTATPAIRGKMEKRRATAQRPLLDLHERLIPTGKLTKRVARLAERLASPAGEVQPLARWARRRLAPRVKRFFKASRKMRRNEAALHRFRIRGKELRYEMELLAGAFSPAFTDELYSVVERAQELVGDINDHAVARDHLRARRSSAKTRALLEAEESALERASSELFSWWTPEFADHIRQRFRSVMSPKRRQQEGRSHEEPPPSMPVAPRSALAPGGLSGPPQ